MSSSVSASINVPIPALLLTRYGIEIKSKTAFVHSIPKNGDRSNPYNYRPTAKTYLFSKIKDTLIKWQAAPEVLRAIAS